MNLNYEFRVIDHGQRTVINCIVMVAFFFHNNSGGYIVARPGDERFRSADLPSHISYGVNSQTIDITNGHASINYRVFLIYEPRK